MDNDCVASPVPADHPLMIAWTAYKETDAYKNSLGWARHPSGDFAEGSMWAAFERGYSAGKTDDRG